MKWLCFKFIKDVPDGQVFLRKINLKGVTPSLSEERCTSVPSNLNNSSRILFFTLLNIRRALEKNFFGGLLSELTTVCLSTFILENWLGSTKLLNNYSCEKIFDHTKTSRLLCRRPESSCLLKDGDSLFNRLGSGLCKQLIQKLPLFSWEDSSKSAKRRQMRPWFKVN